MIKIICNRCEKEIKGSIGHIEWSFKNDALGQTGQSLFTDCDYCKGCMEEIKEFISQCGIRPSTDRPLLAAGPSDTLPLAAGPFVQPLLAAGQTDDKTGKRNSRIDMGKVNALRNAGWNIGKIAEEMSVSPEEIAAEVYKARQKRKSAET